MKLFHVKSAHTILSILLIIILSVHPAAQAHDSQQISGERKNFLQSGIKAVQFGVTAAFNIYSWQGTDISIKKHISKETAIRIGLVFSMYHAGTKRRLNENLQYTKLEINRISEGIRFSLNPQYIKYFKSNRFIHLYYANGLTTGVDYSYAKQANIGPVPSDLDSKLGIALYF